LGELVHIFVGDMKPVAGLKTIKRKGVLDLMRKNKREKSQVTMAFQTMKEK